MHLKFRHNFKSVKLMFTSPMDKTMNQDISQSAFFKPIRDSTFCLRATTNKIFRTTVSERKNKVFITHSFIHKDQMNDIKALLFNCQNSYNLYRYMKKTCNNRPLVKSKI